MDTPDARKQRHETFNLLLGIVGLFVGVIALLVGAYHVYELRHMQNAISTQYLGEFPEFLPQITEVVNAARHDLIIVCDFPGYGDFSAPDNSLKYLQALRARQSDKQLRVEFTCLDETLRYRYLDEQLPAATWNHWSEDGQKRAQVEDFLRLNGHSGQQISTRPQLFKAMTAVDNEVLHQYFLNKYYQTPQAVPIYFWVADCRRAVFSIATPTETGVEHGFVTSDRSLIRALLDLRKRYLEQLPRATRLQQPCKE